MEVTVALACLGTAGTAIAALSSSRVHSRSSHWSTGRRVVIVPTFDQHNDSWRQTRLSSSSSAA